MDDSSTTQADAFIGKAATPSRTTFAAACRTCAARATSICRVVAPSAAPVLARPRQTIYRAGEPIRDIKLICSGWAFTFTVLPDGTRQILSILLLGNMIAASAVLKDSLPFSVQTITDMHTCSFDRGALLMAAKRDPKVFAEISAICADELENAHQLAADLGRRSTEQRVARMFLSLMERLAARNQVRDQSFEFPLRQQHIADATGVTPVHVSRVLMRFLETGLVAMQDRRLTILRPDELRRISNSH